MSKTISSGESSRGFTFKLVMNETTDIETNTSSISWQLQLSLKSGSGWSFYDFGVGWSAYINGTRVAYHDRASSDRYTLTAGNTWTMASGTTSVVHDTDGTKTISCSASMDMATSPSGAGPMSLSGDWELTTIPRASSLTIPTLTIGSSATLSITAASNTFSHEISYVMSDLSGSIASLSAGASSTTWTPPTSFYAKLPNATQGQVSIVIETYTGSTLIGSNTYTVPVNVGSDIKPTTPSITLSPVNTNAWLNSQGLYVGGYTRVRVQSSASPGTGASISSYQISGAFSGTGADVTSGVLTSGVKSITVTATDSRGRSTSNTVSVTFLEYANPSLTTFSAERGLYSGGSWTSDVNGDHIRINAVATVSLSNEGNTGTIVAKVGGISPDVTSGNYFIWTSTNNTTTYEASGTVTDLVGGSSSRSISISTVEVPFNINVDLPGASFGMIAQKARTLELADTWSLEVGGEIRRDGVPVDVEYIRGTWTATTATWTGVTKDSALYDGKVIILFMPYSGSSNVTLNLTLADGTKTGAKNCYLNSTTRLGTEYGQYSQMLMIYHESINIGGNNYTGWWVMGDRNDLAYRIRKNSGGYKTFTACYRYQLLFTKSEDTLLTMNAVNNSTGTSKTLTTESFDPFGAIYFYASTSTTAAGSVISASRLYPLYATDLRYSFNTGSTLTSNKAVYVVCVPQSDGKVKLHSAPISQTLPTTADGLVYIYLGQAYSTYQIELALEHPVYCFANGRILEWTGSADTITETGTDGDWIYRKYLNGVAECWGNFTVSVTGWTAWGSVYEATRSTNLAPSYPTGLFNATPVLNVSIWHPSIGTMGCELYGTHDSTVVPSIIPLRPNSGGTGQIGVSIHSIGKWK